MLAIIQSFFSKNQELPKEWITNFNNKCLVTLSQSTTSSTALKYKLFALSFATGIGYGYKKLQ
jgi:hypothetical protein